MRATLHVLMVNSTTKKPSMLGLNISLKPASFEILKLIGKGNFGKVPKDFKPENIIFMYGFFGCVELLNSGLNLFLSVYSGPCFDCHRRRLAFSIQKFEQNVIHAIIKL
ncbi:hypothetical protein RCL_jg6665.t1 [Rhizophagus clarus]|uniref:Uncharacterized protein n=1 Tax=Rhizophagus clarus TaxID=94130 RepID=A0A8H3LGQ4_9GLOM|nr:hypothetical protein RCL_jg6665.t1 [Rhizophagus clarus]